MIQDYLLFAFFVNITYEQGNALIIWPFMECVHAKV